MNVLVLNCRAASINFAVVHASNGHEHVSGTARPLGTRHAVIEFEHEGRKGTRPLPPNADHAAALKGLDALLTELGLHDRMIGIGHRVAHGGMKFSGPMLITPEVVAKIKECIPLGPLHNPANVTGIEVMQELFPGLPQVAIFDTAFHQTMPPHAYLYAVPYEWFEQHEVRRYGFHGTSHRWVSRHAVQQLGLDPKDHAIVTAHLGYGCSLAAIRNGQSMDTTMGLTPLDGLVMDTRSGTIDPSIIAHMKQALDTSAETVMEALHTRSGLLGISGLSHDMVTLQAAADKGHARAALAIDKFCYSVAKATMSMSVALGRLDALVFTGGIGENNAPVRAKIVEALGFLGMTIDPAANLANGVGANGRITTSTRPMAAVIPTNEELQIAMDTAEVIGNGKGA
ncbi:MAG TPA: acetate kinase [Anaeromyxobacteraceae bacterium]|nr:acetate kinase [Anaeromyxobacteraceae bacterium]